jgi:hypothetical protein
MAKGNGVESDREKIARAERGEEEEGEEERFRTARGRQEVQKNQKEKRT